MPTKVRVWEVRKDVLNEVSETAFNHLHTETELEDWIAGNPRLLGEDLLVIDRQREIGGVGRLDLLCVDSAGKLVIVELKRGMGPREAVAQALDYASWFDTAQIEEVTEFARSFLGKDLEEAFKEHFGTEFPELDVQNHRIMLVAPELDDSAERILTYLASRYSVDINAVLFTYRKLSAGLEILIRSVLVPDAVAPPTTRKVTEAQLIEMADKRGTLDSGSNLPRGQNEDWMERESRNHCRGFIPLLG